MKAKYLIHISLLLILLALSSNITAQDIPEKPNPPKLVNDYAGFLSTSEVQQLENKLVAFNDSTSTQICIVIVPSLNGYEKSDFASRLAQKWGIGEKGKNNGVLVLVKPKTTESRGEVKIETGYGLEGAIPDLVCEAIISNDIVPAFMEGHYYDGLDAGTTSLMKLASGEFTADQYAKKPAKSNGAPVAIIIIILIVIFFIMGKSGRSRQSGIGKKALPWWLLMTMMNSGNSHHGSWGGFSSGSGGFGGGGGGFGGFGGGSFGGGGAGGSW